MAYLEYLTYPEGVCIDLDRERVGIGRSDRNELVLKDESVSREHARIVRRGDAFTIEDCQSRHGTLVNRKSIREPTTLRHGDRITICDTILRFDAGLLSGRDPGAETRLPHAEPARASAQPGQESLVVTTRAVVEPELARGEEAALRLRAVLEIIRCLQTTVQVKELLPKILESLFRIFPQAHEGTFLLPSEGDGPLEPRYTRSRSGKPGEVKVSQTIIQQALDRKQAILSADALSDQDFMSSQSVSNLGIRSFLCAPLLAQNGKPLGILHLHAEKGGRPFADDDLAVLVSVASTTSLALQNLRLHEDLMARERLQREVELSQDIQRRFLPAGLPEVTGYRFHSFYKSARTVGGDYYGFSELPGGQLAISVGDVSGKGVPAALLMARISSDIRYSLLLTHDPAAALASVHRSLVSTAIEEKFVTLLLMVLDPAQHRLTVASAGHPAPLIRRPDGTVDIMAAAAGLPLNVSPDPGYAYSSTSLALPEGSTVFCYTDGLFEARDPAGEFFGLERLREAAAALPGGVEAAGSGLLEAVRKFMGPRAQHDDITLVVLGREAVSGKADG